MNPRGLILLAALALAGCGDPRMLAVPGVGIGYAAAGHQAFHQHGCTSCHVIPGVVGADTHVGPPLTDIARRKYLAGVLPNTPANLVRWLREPQALAPGSAMPDLGVGRQAALDMATYLYGSAPPPEVPVETGKGRGAQPVGDHRGADQQAAELPHQRLTAALAGQQRIEQRGDADGAEPAGEQHIAAPPQRR